MNIYFSGSIRGGRSDADFYKKIIEHLKLYGNVLTEHVGNSSVTSFGENSLTDIEIHDRDMEMINDSNIIVAEVTNPSLGVGYEIRRAIEIGKSVICLYKKTKGKRLSAMISGSKNIINREYTDINSVKKILNEIILKT